MLFRRPLLAILFLICTAVLLCGVSGYQLMTHTLGGGACCGPLCRGGETVWGPQLRQKMRPPAQPAAQLARQALPGPGRRVSGAGQVRLRASADASGEAAIAAQVKRDLEFYEKITAVEDEALRAATISALDTLAQALRLYGPANTVVSFNGGKDADVVLHLMRAASAKHCNDTATWQRPPLVSCVWRVSAFLHTSLQSSRLRMAARTFTHSRAWTGILRRPERVRRCGGPREQRSRAPPV